MTGSFQGARRHQARARSNARTSRTPSDIATPAGGKRQEEAQSGQPTADATRRAVAPELAQPRHSSSGPELQCVQPRVEPVPGQQLRMAAAFDQLAMIQHDHDGRHARWSRGGGPRSACYSAGHQPLQRFLYLALRFAIQHRSGLRPGSAVARPCEGAGDRQPLALPTPKSHGVVTDPVSSPLGSAATSPPDGRRPRARRGARASARAAQSDIAGQGVVEHDHVLADQRELAAQRVQAPIGHVGPSSSTGLRGRTKRGSRLASVDLPEPDGPTRATTWPGSIAA